MLVAYYSAFKSVASTAGIVILGVVGFSQAITSQTAVSQVVDFLTPYGSSFLLASLGVTVIGNMPASIMGSDAFFFLVAARSVLLIARPLA